MKSLLSTALLALGLSASFAQAQRRQIIADYTAGHTVSELARRFAVSRANILGIVKPAGNRTGFHARK